MSSTDAVDVDLNITFSYFLFPSHLFTMILLARKLSGLIKSLVNSCRLTPGKRCVITVLILHVPLFTKYVKSQPLPSFSKLHPPMVNDVRSPPLTVSNDGSK